MPAPNAPRRGPLRPVRVQTAGCGGDHCEESASRYALHAPPRSCTGMVRLRASVLQGRFGAGARTRTISVRVGSLAQPWPRPAGNLHLLPLANWHARARRKQAFVQDASRALGPLRTANPQKHGALPALRREGAIGFQLGRRLECHTQPKVDRGDPGLVDALERVDAHLGHDVRAEHKSEANTPE